MKYIITLMIFALVGCTSVSDEISAYQKMQIEVFEREAYTPETSRKNIHQYIEVLARQLFDTANIIDPNIPLMVGTFLPSTTLKPGLNMDLNQIGLQLQESFTTLSTQAGLNVIDFKVTGNIEVNPLADTMISRDKDSLKTNLKVGYMLTGTYSIQQNEIVINARLIDITDNSIVAAATDEVPTNMMWSHSKVNMKNNQIYRGEY